MLPPFCRICYAFSDTRSNDLTCLCIPASGSQQAAQAQPNRGILRLFQLIRLLFKKLLALRIVVQQRCGEPVLLACRVELA